MKLRAGQAAPDFQIEDILGTPIALGDYAGKMLMISFYRYASCPLCNLRVHELIQRYPEFHAQGLHLLAIFQSPRESIRQYVGKQETPFPLLADPARTLYRRYGVESSWLGFGKALFKLPMVFDAVIKKRFLPGKMENKFAMIPADFLVGPDLKIRRAFYGKDIGDHLPMPDIEDFLVSGR
jgi:peroxiredoxin Q/BCP